MKKILFFGGILLLLSLSFSFSIQTLGYAQTAGPQIQIEPLDLKMDPYIAGKLASGDKELFEMLLNCYMESVWLYIKDKGYVHCFINELTPVLPDKKIVGRARTIRFMPQRPDVEAKMGKPHNYTGSAEAKAGDILVFDCGGDTRGATTGDVTTALFAYNGGAGIICDGALRDIPPIKKMGVQVYQRAGQAAAIPPLMSVDYQVPVRIGNVTVIPGDILLCDTHGILVIPESIAKEAAIAAFEKDMWENFLKTLILRGETVYDRESPEGRFKNDYEAYKKKYMKK